MQTTTALAKWRGFPETPRHPDAIAGSRRNHTTRVVRPVRPDSGRRPEDTGRPDELCVLARVPTVEGNVYLAICEHVEVREQIFADSDAEAISRARESCAPATIACDTTMEEAARAAGIPVIPLSDGQLTLLAVFAVLPGIVRTMTPGALEECDLLRFLRACAGFAWAQAWRSDLVGRLFDVVVSGRGGSERLALVLQPDDGEPGPGFGLLEPEFELAADGATPGLVNAIGRGRLTLVCTVTPQRLHALLLRTLGTCLFPIGIPHRGDAARLDASDVRLLTGVLECIGALTTGAESANADVDGRRISVARHTHDALLERPRGTA